MLIDFLKEMGASVITGRNSVIVIQSKLKAIKTICLTASICCQPWRYWPRRQTASVNLSASNERGSRNRIGGGCQEGWRAWVLCDSRKKSNDGHCSKPQGALIDSKGDSPDRDGFQFIGNNVRKYGNRWCGIVTRPILSSGMFSKIWEGRFKSMGNTLGKKF